MKEEHRRTRVHKLIEIPIEAVRHLDPRGVSCGWRRHARSWVVHPQSARVQEVGGVLMHKQVL